MSVTRAISVRSSGFDFNGMDEKIVALTEYDRTVLSRTHSKANKAAIEVGAANVIAEYFSRLMDAKSRTRPKSFHHVYEWNQVGNSNARLFKSTVTPFGGGAAITFEFLKSKTPNNNTRSAPHIFAQKASVMESGKPVIILPVNAKKLAYVYKGELRFSMRSFVPKPGGKYVAGSFAKEWKSFKAYQAKSALQSFRYFELINESYKQKRRLVIPRITRGRTSSMMAEASKDADAIALSARARAALLRD